MSRLLLQCGKKFPLNFTNRLLQYSKVEFKPKFPKPLGQNVPARYVTLKSSTFICGTSLAVIFKKMNFNKDQQLDSSQKNSINVEDSVFVWRELWNLLKAEIWTILSALVAALLGGYLNIKVSQSLGELVEVFSLILSNPENRSSSGLKKPAIELILLYLGQAFTTYTYISLLAKIGEKVAAKLKFRLFQAVIKQDIAFFDQNRTSTLVDCLTNDIREFSSAIKLLISLGVRNSTELVGGVISLFIVSPIMTVNLSVFIPIVIIVGTYFGSVLRSLSKSAQLESLQTAASFEEAVNNIRTVQAFANEGLECSKFKKHVEETQRLNVLSDCGIGCFEAGTQLFVNSLFLGTITLGLWFIDSLSPTGVMFFFSSAKMVQRSLTQLYSLYGQTVKGKQALKRILYFCNLVPQIPDKGDKVFDDKYFQPCVAFKDVSFAYQTRSNQIVLDRLTLSIPSGKKVAVVGSSGNGKTTNANLLESTLDPESERIVRTTLEDVDKTERMIIIIHRLSAIEKADIIVVLEEGKVVEVGTNEELTSKKGAYWKFVNNV